MTLRGSDRGALGGPLLHQRLPSIWPIAAESPARGAPMSRKLIEALLTGPPCW